MHRTTRYEHFIGPHLWNSVLNDHSDIAHIDFNEFRAFLNTWKGPDISQYAIPSPLMTSSAVSGFSVDVCCVLEISIDIFIGSLHVLFLSYDCCTVDICTLYM